jgi:hypothetical protein
MVLIGWDEVGSHSRCERTTNTDQGELCFSHRGHAAAVSLLRLANLDPLRTTAEEFDKLELRFFCGYCDSANELTSNQSQNQKIRLMNWRECVSRSSSSRRD